MQLIDKFISKFLYLLIIGLFLMEFSAGLAIAHWDSIHECQAADCVNTELEVDNG